MRSIPFFPRSLFAILVLLAALLARPAGLSAQTVSGDARAAQVTVFNPLGGATITGLAETGTLGGTSDARESSLLTGSVPSVLSAEVLTAATIGWPDHVASHASLANLALTVGGTGISADFVMAEATAPLGAPGGGTSFIDTLAIDGVTVAVTGNPNQTITIPGGRLVVNEQSVSAGAATVNAIHATVFGVTDVVIASVSAGIR